MPARKLSGAAIGALTIAGVIGGTALIALLAPPSGQDTATATATATPGATETPGFGAVGTTETVPCPDFLTSGAAITAAGNEVEGKTFSCGVVVVPENHDKPDGRAIELFYLKLHSTAASPEPDPLVYRRLGGSVEGRAIRR